MPSSHRLVALPASGCPFDLIPGSPLGPLDPQSKILRRILSDLRLSEWRMLGLWSA
jgi:hypothetical protein